ncbi:hemolysin-III related-domain-containing protein [Aspergillus leporis]|uniref:Hemolysin-III related-domain-containing protein n=1 Tax=Aspergillus leporis TaxID=41062 RepID=A0A5N5WV16_9EURO|nr:hemolysin-III related-domain-containing protein [Aspergillus leporis]
MAMASLRLSMSSLLTLSPPKWEKKRSVDGRKPLLKQRVFHASQVPGWMQWDTYILHGYRAQLNSFERCFWSLFYLHNESVNTWSHLVPGLYFLILLLAIDYWITQVPLEVPVVDIVAIQTYVAGTAGCLIFSVTAYILFTVFCAVMPFWVALNPQMDGARAGPWRATLFILLATSGLAPIIHVAWAEGPPGPMRIPLDILTVTCSSYAIGTAAYVTRFPERYWPERFDLIGASHQVFHILVAFGQIVHLFGQRELLIRVNLNMCVM